MNGCLQGLGRDLVQQELAQLPAPPFLQQPVSRSFVARHAALGYLASTRRHRRQQLMDVVGRLAEAPVQRRVPEVELEQQVVHECQGGDEAVADASDQGQLQHALGIRDVRDEHTRRVDEEDALTHSGVVVDSEIVRVGAGLAVYDANRSSQPACNAGLRSRLGRLALPHPAGPQPVEQRALSGVGHADDQGLEPEERIRITSHPLDGGQQLAVAGFGGAVRARREEDGGLAVLPAGMEAGQHLDDPVAVLAVVSLPPAGPRSRFV